MHSRAVEVPTENVPTESADDTAARKGPLELLADVEPSAALPPPKLLYGTVEPSRPEEEGELRVTTAEGTRLARRAKSCLVDAEAGDRVLCSTDGDLVYILAVIAGGETTTIKAAGKLEIAAVELKMQARSALLAIDDLRIFGRSAEATFGDKASIIADRIESRASRLLQRAKHAFRFIEGLDQVRAGNIDARAEGLAAMRGENVIVSARVLAKLDGEQVKIG